MISDCDNREEMENENSQRDMRGARRQSLKYNEGEEDSRTDLDNVIEDGSVEVFLVEDKRILPVMTEKEKTKLNVSTLIVEG